MRSAARSFYLAAFALLNAQPGLSCAPSQSAGSHYDDVCAIDPRAIVSDACASYSTLDTLNTQLQPSIQAVTRTTDFFSYYRLNLYNKVCPFWKDDTGLCGNIACAVDTIEDQDKVPFVWRTEELEELGRLRGPRASHPNRKMQQQEKPLEGSLGDDVGESCVVEYDDECDDRDYCIPEDESAAADGDYVSLVDNPERFTGYSGDGPRQVWEAIYRENCFSKSHVATTSSSGAGLGGKSQMQVRAAQDLRSVIKQHLVDTGSPPGTDEPFELDDECLEKRVFYRIISGMHASISTHLCWEYLNKTSGLWEPNLQCFEERLHDHPDRISNLYFNYALVLRAIEKARGFMQKYTFCSGDVNQDRTTKAKVLALADLIAAGPRIYDESLMFQDNQIDGLKEDFRQRFRNVSRTMDCVGCDKCRLWGKLQTSGYGTALKILFEFDEDNKAANPPLRRTEIVALFNTLDRISSSLSAVQNFQTMHRTQHPHDSASIKGSPRSKPMDVSSSLENLTEDDGLDDFTPPRVDPTITSEFQQELDLFWRTTKWVLKRWVSLPREIFQLVILEASRLWDYYLGIPQSSREPYRSRHPLRDEI